MIHNPNRKIKSREKQCKKCNLHKTCVHTNKMDGTGSKRPTWLLVGQNPGRVEDASGEPFVGRAGSLLRDTIDAIEYDLKKCRFTNATRCWSGQGDPAPNVEDIIACRDYLKEEIKECKPTVVIILGNTALKSITNKQGITRLRGTAWEQDNVIYVPTFHPSAILRDSNRLQNFSEDLELAKNIGISGVIETKKSIETSYVITESYDESVDYLNFLSELEVSIANDIETRGRWWEEDAALLASGYCWSEGESVCIPVFKKDSKIPKRDRKRLVKAIHRMHLKRNRRGLKSQAYNAVFDITFPLVVHGIVQLDLDWDNYLAHHLLDEELSMPGLKQLAWFYTDMGGYENEFMTWVAEHPDCDPKKGGTYDNVPLQLFGDYNCGDTDVDFRLKKVLEPRIRKEGLLQVLQDVTLPFSYALSEIVSSGVHLDIPFLDQLSVQYPTRLEKLRDAMRRYPEVRKYERRVNLLAKRAWDLKRKNSRSKPPEKYFYNPSSVDATRTILFNLIGLHTERKTDKGKLSVDKITREELMGEHPIISEITDYKSAEKFHGYIKRFRGGATPEGIYYPFYDIAATVTGRARSDLHQIPRGSTNKDIRKIFTSRFGSDGTLLEADFDQAELRIWAIASGDKALRKIYKKGLDAHKMAAAWAYGIPESEVTTELRTQIKSAVSFGVSFGRKAFALAQDFGWELDEAQEFIDKYFGVFEGIYKQIHVYRDFAHYNGYVVNLFGRKRRLGEAQSKVEGKAKERAMRQAVNFPIQSTAHDLLLVAGSRIHKLFREFDLRSLLIGEIHDELVFDVHNSELDVVSEIIISVMENFEFPWINIPMVVEIKAGPNLLETTKIH